MEVNVCCLNEPIKGNSGIVGVSAFQKAMRDAKKRPSEIASVAIKTLSSLGYLSNMDAELWEKIEPYL